MFSRLALRTLSRNIKPIPSTHLRNTRVFFSPPSPLPSPPSPLKPATPHYLPVIAKETGALRRNAFKNAANDAVALDRDELLKDVSKLSGKTVVITGSGSLEGLGGQLAIKAAEHGARVVVNDLKDEGIDRVVKEIERMGGVATGIACDVTEFDSQLRMFFAQVDVVVACAGVADGTPHLHEEIETDMGEPAKHNMRCLHVNLIGYAYTARLAFYYLRRSPEKDVKAFIGVGSVGSFFAFPTSPLYTASKHGVLGLNRELHYSGLENGVRVSTIAPWIIETPLLGLSVASLDGVPMAKADDFVAATISAATSPTVGGQIYVVDEKGVFTLPHKSSGYLSAQ